MVAKQTTRYTLENTEEAKFFAEGIEAFYGWGGAKVRIIEDGKLLIVEYDHFIDTKDTVFGG